MISEVAFGMPAPVEPSNVIRVAVLGACLLLFWAVYGGIGVMQAEGAELYTLHTPVDDWFPLSPIWVLAYLWLFPQVLSPLAIFSSTRVMKRALIAFVVMVAAGIPFWLFYPVTVPREPVPVEDLWTFGLALTRMIDPPTNCFPSMHVAEAAFAALVMRRHDKLVGNVLIGCTFAIWYSTVALDQHWVVDGAMGLAMALIANALAFRGIPPEHFEGRPRAWHATWLGLYVVLFLIAASGWWTGWAMPYLDQPMWR